MSETKELKFEQAMGELEQLVGKLERGDMALDESLDAFAKGVELVKHCKGQLSQAEKRVEKLVKTDKGVKSESMDV